MLVVAMVGARLKRRGPSWPLGTALPQAWSDRIRHDALRDLTEINA
jgi:hypothetical protein